MVDAKGRYAEISWGRFQRLIKKLGYVGRIGARTVRVLKPDLADAINRKWKSAVAL